MAGWPWTGVQTHCFIPDSSTSFSLLYGAGEMGSRGCRQSLKVSHCHLFLLTLLSCSCVGFHELQSFTINLLQWLFSIVLQDKSDPDWAVYRLQFLQGISTYSGVESCCVDICDNKGPLYRLQENTCSITVFSMATGK